MNVSTLLYWLELASSVRFRRGVRRLRPHRLARPAPGSLTIGFRHVPLTPTYRPRIMKHRTSILAFVVTACWTVVAVGDDDQIDFARDIAPMLSRNCVACHNAKKAEGGLNLESHEALMAGGDSGETIVAGKLEDSYVLSRVTGEEEPWMPPDDNSVGAKRLTTAEIETLQKWIQAGAKQGAMKTEMEIQWQPIPKNLNPVYAMAAAEDNQVLVVGRGNQAIVKSTQDQNSGFALVDSSLSKIEGVGANATHLDFVQSVAMSPDSQRIATGGFRSVKIWKRSLQSEQLLSGLERAPSLTAISPNGKRLAQSFKGGGLEVVDLEGGHAHRFLRSHKSSLTGMVWLADSNRLISCDAQGNWRLTSADGQTTEALEIQDASVGSKLVRTGADRIFGLNQQGQAFELVLDQANPLSASVKVLPDLPAASDLAAHDALPSRLALTANAKVLVVDLGTGKVANTIDTQNEIRDLAIDKDGAFVVTAHAEGPAKLWSVGESKLVADLNRDYFNSRQVRVATRDVSRQQALIARLEKKLPDLKKASEKELEARKKVQETRDKAAEALAARVKEVEAANAGVTEAQKALTAAQAALAAAQKQVETTTADLEKKKQAVTAVMPKKAEAEAVLAKRDQALAAASDSAERAQKDIPEHEGLIQAEKEQLGQLEVQLKALQSDSNNPTYKPTTVAFDASTSHVVLVGSDHAIRTFGQNGDPLSTRESVGPLADFRATANQSLVGLNGEGQVYRWNLGAHWTLERVLGSYRSSPFSDRVTALDFSPDGAKLAVGSGPPSRFGEIKIVDVSTGEISSDLGEVHSDTVLGIRFSPNGRQLASVGADRMCRLFDIPSGQLIRNFEGHTHHILGVAWRDSGESIATASADATVKVWKVETGEQLRTITGFSKEVTSVAFVGQTSQIVSASADGSIRLHNTDDGKQIRSFGGASDSLYSVAVSPNEKALYAGGQAGKVWTWQLGDGKLTGTYPAPENSGAK